MALMLNLSQHLGLFPADYGRGIRKLSMTNCNNPNHRDGAWETVGVLGKTVAELVHTLAIVRLDLALANKSCDIGPYGRLALEVLEKAISG